MYFADRVHANFFNDGPFYVDPDNPDWNPDLPGQNRPADLWMNRAGKIELAVIAESARWGDYRRDVHQYYEQGPFELYTRNDHWFTEQNNLLTNYFPNRTQTVLRHYRDADLYPGIDAPVFDRQAGQIPPGSLLTMQADVPGTIYYTTDGTDPRLPNTRQRATTVLVAEDAEKFIRIPDSIEDSRSQPLFEIMSIKANIPLTNLSIASQVILSPDYQQSTITETCNVINFLGEGPNGHFLEDNAFPHGSTGSAPDDFVFYAIGKVDIPAPGPWTFGVNSDDGFFLVVGPLLAFHQDIRQPADTLTVYDFPQSGEQVVYMRFFQHTDGAHVELFAAQGTFTEFDPQQFRLVGDTQNGGLPLTSRTFWYQLDFDHTNWNEYTTIATTSGAVGFSQDNSFDQYVTYDLVDSMQNKSSSCYIRIPFTVEAYDLEFIDELKLNVRYDDGFVAYLNGTEIARASAPAQLDFDSAATLERPNEQALTIESFDVLQFKDKFQNGQNILAIQGLNINDTDDDFLISAELLAGSLGPCQISSTAIEYTAPITIDADTQINARLLSQREWSALNNTAFTTAP